MTRRILLLVTTLGALVAAYYVYSLVAGRDPAPKTDYGDVPGRWSPPQTGGQGGVTLDRVKGLRLVARDEAGRVEALYLAEEVTRRADGSYLLEDVRVELHHKNGQKTILRADQAEVYGEELDRGANIRRAHLTGNVRVYFDPSKEPDRLPVEQREDEVVRVLVDEVEVDNEHLTIATEGPVAVYSPEADVFGRGLHISWNESPRELRVLRLTEGRYMAVYNVPAELDVLALPGAEAGEPNALAEPTTAPAAASQPASRPTTRSTTAPAEPQPQNQYVAEFRDNIKVVQGRRRLEGADALRLRFDWDSSWRGADSGLTGRRRARPATRPATAPATAPAPASTRPAGEREDGPMEIFWTGPLVLRPVGRTETPSRRRYEVSATGRRVVLADPRATAGCREFLFRHPAQAGFLLGTKADPARLLLAEGAEVACEKIRFEPKAGRAYLDGPGQMSRRFEQGLSQQRAMALIQRPDANRAPDAEKITWGRKVEIAFATERAPDPNGQVRTRQVLREAEFFDDVLLQQGPDPNDDFVRCKRLKVFMARGERVAALPERAVATGGVVARQEGADVRAETVTVHFVEAGTDAETVEPGAAPVLAGRVRPSTVEAGGGVTVTDRREGQDPVVAQADRLRSNLIDRTVTLHGEPAVVRQGPNHLTGAVIRLDQEDGSAEVDGKGKVSFLTTRDMNGRRLATPRPLEVTWSREMQFHGRRRTATFGGDVALDSAEDQVRCGKMQILFSADEPAKPAPAATQPATRPAPTGRDKRRFRGMAVEMERYSRRRISMILADDDIALRSRRRNDANQLIRRVQLSGDKLIYDAENARMTMLGEGTFLAEDYQPPRPKDEQTAPDEADMLGGSIDRPSQTAFQWHRSMQFSQHSRLVLLDGEVTMVHRSGDKVVLTEKLDVPRQQWGVLTDGRRTVLKCGHMMVKFAPPDEATTRPAGDVLAEGPDLGPVEQFTAQADINLKDGPWQVLAQQIKYYRPLDRALILGYLDGKPAANATVYHEDPKTGRSQSWASPKIVWFRKNNKIVTEQVTGAGGR